MIRGNRFEYPPYVYLLTTSDNEKQQFLLPNKERTSLTCHGNVEFNLNEEEYFDEDEPQDIPSLPHEIQQDVDEDGFPNFDLSEPNFMPQNNHERTLHNAYQHGKINKWVMKMLGKFKRKFKKSNHRIRFLPMRNLVTKRFNKKRNKEKKRGEACTRWGRFKNYQEKKDEGVCMKEELLSMRETMMIS